jgi:hypothetical protein
MWKIWIEVLALGIHLREAVVNPIAISSQSRQEKQPLLDIYGTHAIGTMRDELEPVPQSSTRGLTSSDKHSSIDGISGATVFDFYSSFS